MKTIVKVEKSKAEGVFVATLECGHVRYYESRRAPRKGGQARCTGLRRGLARERKCES